MAFIIRGRSDGMFWGENRFKKGRHRASVYNSENHVNAAIHWVTKRTGRTDLVVERVDGKTKRKAG